jgi:hypothetical protein
MSEKQKKTSKHETTEKTSEPKPDRIEEHEPEQPLQVRMVEWARTQPAGASYTMEEAANILNVSVEEFRANFMILRQVDQKLDGLLVYPR